MSLAGGLLVLDGLLDLCEMNQQRLLKLGRNNLIYQYLLCILYCFGAECVLKPSFFNLSLFGFSESSALPLRHQEVASLG